MKAAKSIPHMHSTQWLLSNQSSPSTGSPNSKHSKYLTPYYPSFCKAEFLFFGPELKSSFKTWRGSIDNSPKQPSWDQMEFYYPKFNPHRLSYANTKSTSSSSTTATPLPSSSSSNSSGPQIGKVSNGEYVFKDFHHTTHQAPEIPRAIPARYSFNDGSGTLDRILDNPHSTTNIHIRGFHSNTTDAMTQRYGSRFGEIETAKSVIDHLINTCKGYGFIKYYSFTDAENLIRGYYYRGCEAKFAKIGPPLI